MVIDNLPSLPNSIQSTDEFMVDRDGQAYKILASEVVSMENRYIAGDTVNLGGVILAGTKLSSGAIICSIMLPKIVPLSLTITHNLTVGWVRGNGISDSSGLTVSSVTRASNNVLQIAITGSTIPVLYAAVINISAGSISFS